MRRLSLAFVLLLIGLPAQAANYYVREAATGLGTGADASNCMAISTFNALGVGGNTALLIGNFTTTPNPAVAGTVAAPTTYRSLTNNPDDVSFNCTSSGGYHALHIPGALLGLTENVVLRAVTVTSSVVLGGQAGGTFGADLYQVSRYGLRNVKISNGVMRLISAKDCRLDSVFAYTTASTNGILELWGGVDGCERDTIHYSSFEATALDDLDGVNSAGAVSFQGNDNLIDQVRMLVTVGSGVKINGVRLARVTSARRLTLRDSRIYCTQAMNTSTSTDEPLTVSIKDGGRNCYFLRDTIIIAGTSNVGSAPWINLCQAEGAVPVSIGANKYEACYIANRTPAGELGWAGFDGDTLIGNTFVANVTPFSSYTGYPQAGSGITLVDHNLFASIGGGAAFAMRNIGAADQRVFFTNNIFYARGLTDADTNTTRAVNFGEASLWTSVAVGPTDNDHNIAWMPGVGFTKKAVAWSAGTSAFGTAGWLTARTPETLDPNSIYGRCTFADSSLASFDAQPLAGSAALFGPQGYVGPLSFSGVVPEPVVLQWVDPITVSAAGPPGGGIHRYTVPYTVFVVLSNPSATGTVQLQVDGVNVGDPVTVVGGRATLKLTSITDGLHEISAVYSGDANFLEYIKTFMDDSTCCGCSQ